jgi:hypothetical protein
MKVIKMHRYPKTEVLVFSGTLAAARAAGHITQADLATLLSVINNTRLAGEPLPTIEIYNGMEGSTRIVMEEVS